MVKPIVSFLTDKVVQIDTLSLDAGSLWRGGVLTEGQSQSYSLAIS